MEINLKLLTTFQHVAETGSFTAAAQRCFRSVSAVSMQIAELERQLGVQLLQRTTRQLSLTPKGNLLHLTVSRTLRDVSEVIQLVKGEDALEGGKLTIACIPSFASQRLPRLLAHYKAAFPLVSIEVREAESPRVHELVREREVQVGIALRPDVESTETICNTILRERIYALAPVEMNLSNDTTLDARTLAQHPMISMHEGSALHSQIVNYMQREKIEVRSIFEVKQLQTAIAMAEAGLGIAFVPEMMLPDSTTCSILTIDDPPFSREVCLVFEKGAPVSSPAIKFVDQLHHDTTLRSD